jgi:hypothetical protein
MMDILEIITTTEAMLVIAILSVMVAQAPILPTVLAAAIMHITTVDIVDATTAIMAMIVL